MQLSNPTLLYSVAMLDSTEGLQKRKKQMFDQPRYAHCNETRLLKGFWKI